MSINMLASAQIKHDLCQFSQNAQTVESTPKTYW